MPRSLVALLSVCVVISACALSGTGQRGQVDIGIPKGMNSTVDTLADTPETYNAFYSGPNPARPGALLFIPKKRQSLWSLPRGHINWRRAATVAETRAILNRLQDDDLLRQLRIRTLYPPDALAVSQAPIGYLYSIAGRRAVVSRTNSEKATLHPVREPLREIDDLQLEIW